MIKTLDSETKKVYSFFSGTTNNLAKWYDLFWFIIPICGVIGFVLTVEEREKGKK